MKPRTVCAALFAAAFSVTAPAATHAQDTIRIALIEPFSGPMAAVGSDFLQGMQLIVDTINKSGETLGKKLEIVPLDNAGGVEKTTEQLRKAIDDGIVYITQGTSSNNALDIIEQLNKYNERNPDHPVLFLNHSAVTTSFTNDQCSFWHFRFDSNVDQKLAGLLTAMGRDHRVKRVYMLNQNYELGRSVEVAATKMFPERVPNAQIVGDELIVPFGKVQDFTPFVAKLKAANADSVLTANWGPDVIRFVKAVADSGLNVQFFTFYGGQAAALSGYGKDAGLAVHLKQVTETHENMDQSPDAAAFAALFREKTGKTWYADHTRLMFLMLAKAMQKAGTTDPKAVARALEGMTLDGPIGEVLMRAEDHQIQMPMVVSEIDENAPKKFIYNNVDFGVGFRTVAVITREQATLPTTCKMQRP